MVAPKIVVPPGSNVIDLSKAQTLFDLARDGNIVLIKRVVDSGADVNAGDEDGKAPLHWAAVHDKVDAIRCLVRECKANVNVCDSGGNAPLHWATWYDKVAAIRCLVSECKANVDAVDEEGRTALHLAAWNDKVAAIRCLVSECQANLNVVDAEGRTPLQHANKSGTKKLLRELGATSQK